MDKINILGTEYSIQHDLQSVISDGDCGLYDKKIRIRITNDMLDGEESTIEERELREKEVIRHEVAHAFLFESGRSEWARDEDLVDFLAIQSPKLFKLFQDLNVL